MAALLSAPAVAQSGYVFELDAGKLVPARSTEGIAPSGAAAMPQGVAVAQVGGSSTTGMPSRRGSARAGASSVSDGLYFRSCDEAALAGFSSMAIGTPGYREGLDGDQDGVACEPYTGRRGGFRRRR